MNELVVVLIIVGIVCFVVAFSFYSGVAESPLPEKEVVYIGGCELPEGWKIEPQQSYQVSTVLFLYSADGKLQKCIYTNQTDTDIDSIGGTAKKELDLAVAFAEKFTIANK